MFRKFSLLALVAIIMLVLAACGEEDLGEEEATDTEGSTSVTEGEGLTPPDKFLQVGTGPMGSGWYPITTVLSDIYMGNFKDLNVSQIEGGSVANLRSLDVGDIQIGLNYTSDFADALSGGGDFEGELDTIAAAGSLYPVYQTIAVLDKNKNITEIKDIEDKHIFLGPKNGGGPMAFWRMMEEYGIDEESVTAAGGKFSYGGYNDGASMLADGTVDVFLAGGAPAVPALEEMELTNQIRVLSIDDDKLEAIKEKGYGIDSDELPAGTYKGQDDPIPTYTTITMMTYRADLDEDYAYDLTRLFWENMEQFDKQIPERSKHFTLDTVLDGIDADALHPGAKKYYEEEGVLD